MRLCVQCLAAFQRAKCGKLRCQRPSFVSPVATFGVRVDGVCAGLVAVADAVKSDSKVAVAAFKRLGMRVWMVTGDNERTARAVARQVGVDEVVSEVLPADKAAIVKERQQKGEKVLMVGDGINDAPALAQADIGMAIGAGTDVALECADIVLIKNRLSDAVAAVELSQVLQHHRHPCGSRRLLHGFRLAAQPNDRCSGNVDEFCDGRLQRVEAKGLQAVFESGFSSCMRLSRRQCLV